MRQKIEDFLYREAELLDEFHLEEWLKLLTDDIEYKVYILTIPQKNSKGNNKFLISNDNKKNLELKIKRLLADYSWSENPYYQVSRLITNILIDNKENYINVKSKILLYKFRHNSKENLVATRYDMIIIDNDENIKIKKRDVVVMGYPIDLKNIDQIL